MYNLAICPCGQDRQTHVTAKGAQTKSSRAEKSAWESGEIGQPKAQGEEPDNSAVPGSDFSGPLLGERDSI